MYLLATLYTWTLVYGRPQADFGWKNENGDGELADDNGI